MRRVKSLKYKGRSILLPSQRRPFFNLVDDSDLTQEELIGTIAKYFEIEYGAMNTVASAWAKVSCRHMNVHH